MEVPQNMRALLKQSSEVIVVDNGSGPPYEAVLAQLAMMPNVKLIGCPRNAGIGAALNLGLRTACESGCEWVAVFDQDSRVTPGFFQAMRAGLDSIPKTQRVALLAARPVAAKSIVDHAQQAMATPVTVATTSGSLIHIDTFQQVGGFDESLFIDYVDFDYCLRLHHHGYRVYLIHDAVLRHHLGEPVARSLFGITVSIRSHSALRRYFITRNRLLVWKRHALHFPGWFFQDFCWFWLDLVKVCFLETHKRTKVKALCLGMRDALAGRTGECPTEADLG